MTSLKRHVSGVVGRTGLVVAGLLIATSLVHSSPKDRPPPVVIDEGRPIPMELSEMDGEWSGLGAEDANLLVTLRVDRHGKTLLALAQDDGSSTTTKVVEMIDWRMQDGKYSIRSFDGEWTLQGEASRSWHAHAWGPATLTWRDHKGGHRQTELHMFSLTGRSWMKGMLDLARRYALF